ncbi:threonine ammonia-lyase, partial [Caldalkalibacillus mannanilyticus]|uniref:threonine ammonia-lyase n=1 Tax=Caldalkalibacillus mannanilyticus TaxID=1418 RepID=UPI00046A07F4
QEEALKFRGGVNIMHHLKNTGVKGVITFSTGNHGISVAMAAKWFDLEAVIVVSKDNNPAKNQLIMDAGATLIEDGTTFEEAAQAVERLQAERNLYYIHAANEPHLINGVGTEFIEIMRDLPDVHTVILPIGGGSELAAGVTVLKEINPAIEIIAVQAEASKAAYLSWERKKILTAENKTFAGGFATGAAFDIPFEIYKDKLQDFVLLSEEEIKTGMKLSLEYTRQVAEGAGAASIMAAIKMRQQLQGEKVVLQMSGCNTDLSILKEVVEAM